MLGGGVVGCELAYSLAYEKHLDVTIVEMQSTLMNGVVHANRSMLLWLMMGKGSVSEQEIDKISNVVKVYTSSKAQSFKDGKVIITANRKRQNPYTPWTTLIPENIHNPFSKKT